MHVLCVSYSRPVVGRYRGMKRVSKDIAASAAGEWRLKIEAELSNTKYFKSNQKS
jgi:hypothetical protein